MSARKARAAWWVLALALGVACEPPPVFPGADRRQNAKTSSVQGDLVVTSLSRGDVVVLLFDAARPPPPQGTGRPVAFTVVPQATLFGAADASSAGPFTAPYAFSLVPPGKYLVRAFLDANHDFIPWYGVTGEVNAGDVGGAAIDAVSRAPREVEVALDDRGFPQPALGVAVSVGDTAKVPVDRPVFEPLGQPESVTLTAPRVTVDLLPKPVVDGPISQARPVFLAQLVDANGDGRPDDSNGDGTPDFWPRVVVRKLAGEHPLVDENDLDRNGLLDATGQDYEHVNPMTGEAIAADGQPDLVVLQAGFDFSEYLPQLVDAMGRVKTTPTPVPKLKLVLLPRALDASNPAQPQVLKSVPSGRYAVTLIQSTGQTWRLPNELTPGVAEKVGLPAVASQGFVVLVP